MIKPKTNIHPMRQTDGQMITCIEFDESNISNYTRLNTSFTVCSWFGFLTDTKWCKISTYFYQKPTCETCFFNRSYNTKEFTYKEFLNIIDDYLSLS
jgi:hypothetical protein